MKAKKRETQAQHEARRAAVLLLERTYVSASHYADIIDLERTADLTADPVLSALVVLILRSSTTLHTVRANRLPGHDLIKGTK